MDNTKKFYSIKEVSALFSVSKSALYDAIYKGKIPCKRLGRRILIPKKYVIEFVND